MKSLSVSCTVPFFNVNIKPLSLKGIAVASEQEKNSRSGIGNPMRLEKMILKGDNRV